MISLILILLIVAILLYYNPSCDINKDGDLIVWYGDFDNRKYIIIYKR